MQGDRQQPERLRIRVFLRFPGHQLHTVGQDPPQQALRVFVIEREGGKEKRECKPHRISLPAGQGHASVVVGNNGERYVQRLNHHAPGGWQCAVQIMHAMCVE